MRGPRALAAVGAALLGILAAAPPASAEWELFPLPPPPGGDFSTPVGLPGDLSFWSPNRGLMTVGGNNAVPEGLYSWDGVEWHQLAVVCGAGENARIAWAGPREFWTIARPSRPRPQRDSNALCHFKDGQVVASYSTPALAPDRYAAMNAAACRGPNDCWFGGIAAQDGTGERVGAFHLRWDGTALRTVYNPEGRAVSDLLAHGGDLFESTFVGSRSTDPPNNPENPPLLLNRIVGETFVDDPFLPDHKGLPPDATELVALDGAGAVAWAVGGSARTGPTPFLGRPPLAARLEGGTWTEVPLSGDVTNEMVFRDVAAIPGTRTAWVTVRGLNDGTGEQSDTTNVALITETGEVQVDPLVGEGDPERGAAIRVACPAANDCWLATGRGYLYRNSTAGPYERDTDPAFQGLIVTRPNEAAEQSIPDVPPEDDSQLHAPPVELAPPPPPANQRTCDPIPSAISRVRKPQVRDAGRLVVRFRLRRRARVGLVAYRGRRVVARAKVRRMRAGQRRLVLRVSRRRWPTRLRFVVRDEQRPRRACRRGGGTNDNVVTTGPAR